MYRSMISWTMCLIIIILTIWIYKVFFSERKLNKVFAHEFFNSEKLSPSFSETRIPVSVTSPILDPISSCRHNPELDLVYPNANLIKLDQEWTQGQPIINHDGDHRRGLHASVRLPLTTVQDQITCGDYAKATCQSVQGIDRQEWCLKAQLDQCLQRRQRPLWI